MALLKHSTFDLPAIHAVCHAWNHDRTLLACCHGGPAFTIYRVSRDGACPAAALLEEHNQTVSSMQWSRSGLLVTCSHDRTGYVWSQVCLCPTVTMHSGLPLERPLCVSA
jgi:hypothetical protein